MSVLLFQFYTISSFFFLPFLNFIKRLDLVLILSPGSLMDQNCKFHRLYEPCYMHKKTIADCLMQGCMNPVTCTRKLLLTAWCRAVWTLLHAQENYCWLLDAGLYEPCYMHKKTIADCLMQGCMNPVTCTRKLLLTAWCRAVWTLLHAQENYCWLLDAGLYEPCYMHKKTIADCLMQGCMNPVTYTRKLLQTAWCRALCSWSYPGQRYGHPRCVLTDKNHDTHPHNVSKSWNRASYLMLWDVIKHVSRKGPPDGSS